jgi:hypothetical protein
MSEDVDGVRECCYFGQMLFELGQINGQPQLMLWYLISFVSLEGKLFASTCQARGLMI